MIVMNKLEGRNLMDGWSERLHAISGGCQCDDLRRMCVGLYVSVMIFFGWRILSRTYACILERSGIEGCVEMRFTEKVVARLGASCES